jgi:hypothetical protein
MEIEESQQLYKSVSEIQMVCKCPNVSIGWKRRGSAWARNSPSVLEQGNGEVLEGETAVQATDRPPIPAVGRK